ncbi:DUF4350 domain-containing protein [Brachybacterium paraconglomeratum]|uniref:DUF4350 domain-containing protein n=1 Tax=Brachybacterium paraconglomeratum TaxID=173362 RepID=UPI00026C72D6|nr:DUF4350 domain-containing protein [Brachybacterium paraconglomeratum]
MSALVPTELAAPHGAAGTDAAPPGAGAPRGAAQERRRPWLVAAVVLAVIAAVLVSVARGLYRDGPLEPDAPTGQGAKAVVQVLGDLGVEVETRRHTADAAEDLRAGGTVLLTAPKSLSGEQLTMLAEAREEGGGRLIVLRPDFVALSYLTSGIIPTGALREQTRVEAGAACGDLPHGARVLEVPDAEDALDGPASLYTATDAVASTCFEAEGGALVAESDGVLVLGSPDLLTNDGVGRADNSALALNALSASDELTWYVPSATDPQGISSPSLVDHLPEWIGPVAAWLVLAAVLALIALGRRPGPVVVEPLPVTVRPQELVLGRARLLQQASARDAAAAALRAAAATRLADRLGLRHESALDGLLAALAPHVEESPEQLRALLGPAPVATDRDLVRLAHDLDRLEKEIDR